MARKKKKKFSIKKTLRLVIPVLLIIVLLININKITTYFQSKITGYSQTAITTFKEEDIYHNIKKNEYSKTLEAIINTKYYNETYLFDYLQIKYHEKDDFLKNINILLSLGYNYQDINTIYENLTDESINLLLNSQYLKDITNIINLSFFKEDNLDRYIKYISESEYDSETSIVYVNIGLDNEYYTNVSNIENQDDLLVLVNKYNVLDKNYIPADLETTNSQYGTQKLRKEARIAFEKMCEGAKKDNIYIYAGSGYRSYSYQQNLYNRYVALDGKAEADTYSARAGYSEHQTGLAIDILNGNWQYVHEEDKEFTWLVNNSYKYGYILRYPKGKEYITGYMYEEWHFRYVGTEVAKEIYDLDITYDEYVAKSLIKS